MFSILFPGEHSEILHKRDVGRVGAMDELPIARIETQERWFRHAHLRCALNPRISILAVKNTGTKEHALRSVCDRLDQRSDELPNALL
jgi:hypothetical protein